MGFVGEHTERSMRIARSGRIRANFARFHQASKGLAESGQNTRGKHWAKLAEFGQIWSIRRQVWSKLPEFGPELAELGPTLFEFGPYLADSGFGKVSPATVRHLVGGHTICARIGLSKDATITTN